MYAEDRPDAGPLRARTLLVLTDDNENLFLTVGAEAGVVGLILVGRLSLSTKSVPLTRGPWVSKRDLFRRRARIA